MNEFEFDRLIELYQKNLLSGKEKKLVEDWLNIHGTNEDTVLKEDDQLALKHKILNSINEIAAPVIPLERHEKRHEAVRVRPWVYQIAATLTLVALFSYFLLQKEDVLKDNVKMLHATSTGSINKIILSDGTLVWLKGNSSLSYPPEFSGATRNVSLQGEALFEVAKDAQHPFVISCGDLTTTVLGTSFNIKSSDEKIEVVVLTGKVSLTSSNNKNQIIVLPNEKVIYDGRKHELISMQQADEEKLVSIHGTDYLMAFEDSRMSEVIERIEKKFNIRVSVSDPTLRNCMITADFSDQSLENTLSMISQALNFSYSINAKSVMLSGEGCE